MTRTIKVLEFAGREFELIKRNPKKYIVKDLITGDLKAGPHYIYKDLGFRDIEENETEKNIFRPGSLVTVNPTARIRSHKRWTYSVSQVFVLLGESTGMYWMVPVGGSEDGTKWKTVTTDLIAYDFKG